MGDNLAKKLVENALELRRRLADLPAVNGLPFLLRLEAEYRSWPDAPVPLLGGETPREAALTPAGRRRVFHLIHAMPSTLTPAGPLRPPREWLLCELGFTR